MNCEDFDRRLDALLDAACGEDEWREAESQLAGCARCRALFEGAAGRGATMDPDAHASLTSGILRRTGRDPCGSARDRLCGFVDGALDPFDRDLVAEHLSHCAPCTALADALARSAAVLPSLAAMAPPAGFVADVLALTSRRPVEPSIADRLAAWLGRAALRPRFSLEVAYVCTLLLALVFGNPVKAFKETASKGAAFAQPRVEMAVERLAAPLAAARVTGEAVVGKAVARFSSPGSAAGQHADLLQSVQQWWETSVVQRVRSMLGAAADWLRSAQAMANDVAARLLGRESVVAPDPVEPARGPAR